MKARNSTLLLLIAAIAFSVSILASPQQASHTQSPAPRTFSSEFGFDIYYPSDWSGGQLGPILPSEKLSLDPQSQTDPYRRSIECSQNIFSARTAEPRSTFIVGVITTECMGAPPDLDAFSRRTMNSISRGYDLSKTENGGFSVSGQKFWLLRTRGSNHRFPDQTETIEYLATVLPKGLVYVSAHLLTAQAQSSFERAHIHLAGGVETELIPPGVLDPGQAPNEDITRLGAASTSSGLIPYDKNVSHHFDILAGFTYEIPADLEIFNTEKWVESLKQDSTIPPPTHTCSHIRLVATPEDNSRQVILTIYPQSCFHTAIGQENLQFLIATDTINLQKKYTMRNPEYAFFAAGAHNFAVMRTPASNKEAAWEADRYLAIVLAPVPDGVAEFFLMGRTRAGLDAMMATVLKFTDGTQTALVPADAFAHPRKFSEIANSASAPGSSTGGDLSASHHFDSGLGFALAIPQDFAITNAQRAVDAAKAIVEQRPMTPNEQVSVQCAQPLLAAGREDQSRMMILIAYTRDCVGLPLSPETLPTIGQSGIDKLSKRYVFTSIKTASGLFGPHPVWAMQSRIAPNDPRDPHRYLAVTLIPTAQGLAECLMEANTQADLDALKAIPIRFDDGTETTLISERAFASHQSPPSAANAPK